MMVEGEVLIDGNSVNLRVGVTAAFPGEAPYIQLVADERNARCKATAHIGTDGDVCYSATRDLVIDPLEPVETLLACYEQAFTVLRKSLDPTQDNSELLDEFVAYWPTSPESRKPHATITSYLVPDDRLREVAAWRLEDTAHVDRAGRFQRRLLPKSQHYGPYLTVADRDDIEAPNRFSRLAQTRHLQPGATALYLPLQPVAELVPPPPGRHWSPAELREIVHRALAPDDLSSLIEITDRRHQSRDLVILGIPRPGRSGPGRYGLVAIQLRAMRHGHLLGSTPDLVNPRLTSLGVKRHDRATVMQRGSSNLDLASKKVLLIGCGALGGHVALALGSSGVGHATLVDRDVFSIDNAFRHVLGAKYNGQAKVEGMRFALLERYPFMEVEPHFSRSADILPSLQLGAFDLIIDATGDMAHLLTLNDLWLKIPIENRPPLLATWLEAMGLGGHVATFIPQEGGCPRCLFCVPEHPLYNVATFTAPDQILGNDSLGCGTYHTPFTDLDAIRTSEMAARMAVNMLKGQEERSRLRSWRGDPAPLLAAGYRLSKRFENEDEVDMLRGLPLARAGCLHCGGPT